MARSKKSKPATRYIVGIDEVGRGPLAGPVVVGAVLLPLGFSFGKRKPLDSKKLSQEAREDWVRRIKGHLLVSYTLARVSAKSVDRINISRAANLAAWRAFNRLIKTNKLKAGDCSVYLDGGLYLGDGKRRLPGKTIVKGDEKIAAIALASIVAKVHRDAIMTRYAKTFPGYGFEVHKGYGTKSHLKAFARLGPARIHRLTFLGKWNTMSRKQSHGRRTNKTSYTR